MFFFPENVNCSNKEIYTDDSCIFCNYETICPQSLRHLQHTSANVKTLYTNVVKFPAST